MVTILRVKFNILYFSIANFLLRAKHIKMMLYPNPHFGAPPVSMENFGTAIEDLEDAVNAYEDKPSLKGLVEERREIVSSMIVSLGLYVQSCNDEAKINTSGFELYSPKTPVNEVSAFNLTVTTSGMPGVGTVFLKWKKSERGVYTCLVQHTAGVPTATSVWSELVITTKSKCQLTVEPGTHSFRIVAVGAEITSDPCAPVTIVVG